MSWYGCKGESSVRARDLKGTAKEEKTAWPREAKAQQSGMPIERKNATREGGSRQEVRKTFKILRKVWLNIRVEKIDTHSDGLLQPE